MTALVRRREMINTEDIDAFMHGIYRICDDCCAKSTMGVTMKVIGDNDGTTIFARVLYGMRAYRIREEHSNFYAAKVKKEVDTMIKAFDITSGMGPRVIRTFPENIDEIDTNTDGICCIVVFEDITSIPTINTLDCKNAKLQILYSVGSAISALHTAGIYYYAFDNSCIRIQDNSIRLIDIGKNFEFELFIGTCDRRVMDSNNCYTAPELCETREREHSEQKIDSYAFGIFIFTIVFGDYGIFPASDSTGRAYGARNPVPPELIAEHKTRQREIWEALPQGAKELFGGLPNTYPKEHPNGRFNRIGGFVECTQQPVGGLLCQDPAMRLTISKSLDNEWFKIYAIQLEESAASEEESA